MQRKRLSDIAKLPPACPPVSGKYTLSAMGCHLENNAWLPHLTRPIENEHGIVKLIGREPRAIPANILAASGHPPKSATERIKVYLRDLEVERDPKKDRGLKRLRELCIECAGTVVEVRKCAIINCPLWAHRMGTNPHNHHKRHAKP